MTCLLILHYHSFRIHKNVRQHGSGDGRILKVSLVQSCISPWENWGGNRFIYLSELKHYTKGSLGDNPDFIIWSESATLELISFRALTGEQ